MDEPFHVWSEDGGGAVTSASRRLLTSEQGFTLLDNLITLAIMMFTMLALVGLLGTVVTANAVSKKRSLGLTLAENKIAEVRRQGYNPNLTSNTTQAEGYNTIPDYPLYRRVTLWQVNTPMSGMQTVTVTVYWDADRRLASKSTQLAQ